MLIFYNSPREEKILLAEGRPQNNLSSIISTDEKMSFSRKGAFGRNFSPVAGTMELKTEFILPMQIIQYGWNDLLNFNSRQRMFR
jgi:hypothetical protein